MHDLKNASEFLYGTSGNVADWYYKQYKLAERCDVLHHCILLREAAVHYLVHIAHIEKEQVLIESCSDVRYLAEVSGCELTEAEIGTLKTLDKLRRLLDSPYIERLRTVEYSQSDLKSLRKQGRALVEKLRVEALRFAGCELPMRKRSIGQMEIKPLTLNDRPILPVKLEK